MAIGLVVFDLITLLFAIAFYGGAAWAAREAYERLLALVPWPVSLVLSGVVFLFVLIAEVSLAVSLTPRPRPGRFPLMKSAVFWGWMMRMMFTRLLFIPGIKKIIFSSAVLRFLTLRGLGARVAFTANMSTDVELLDPALLEVGPEAMLGAKAFISGHFVEKGELRLDMVKIGKKALLAYGVTCAPGVVVGDGALVQPNASLSVRVKIGNGAVVGVQCLLESDVVVDDGARIPTMTHLPPKARFPSP